MDPNESAPVPKDKRDCSRPEGEVSFGSTLLAEKTSTSFQQMTKQMTFAVMG